MCNMSYRSRRDRRLRSRRDYFGTVLFYYYRSLATHVKAQKVEKPRPPEAKGENSLKASGTGLVSSNRRVVAVPVRGSCRHVAQRGAVILD